MFLDAVPDPKKRKDAKALLGLMKAATGERPAMWGSSIVGFGEYHYKYDSGREGDSCVVGFSPRAQNLTVYISPGYVFPQYKSLLAKLGPHKLGKACLYIKRLEDVDAKVLSQLVKRGYEDMKKRYPTGPEAMQEDPIRLI